MAIGVTLKKACPPPVLPCSLNYSLKALLTRKEGGIATLATPPSN
jgi:hypothetical protein